MAQVEVVAANCINYRHVFHFRPLPLIARARRTLRPAKGFISHSWCVHVCVWREGRISCLWIHDFVQCVIIAH